MAVSGGESVDWLALGGGCTDFALDARVDAREPVRFRMLSPIIGRDPPSIDVRVESTPFLSEAALGLRFRDSKSPASNNPGPTDFLGGFTIFEFETGG